MSKKIIKYIDNKIDKNLHIIQLCHHINDKFYKNSSTDTRPYGFPVENREIKIRQDFIKTLKRIKNKIEKEG